MEFSNTSYRRVQNRNSFIQPLSAEVVHKGPSKVSFIFGWIMVFSVFSLCKFSLKVSIYLFPANKNLGKCYFVFFKTQRNSILSVSKDWNMVPIEEEPCSANQGNTDSEKRRYTTEYIDSDTSLHENFGNSCNGNEDDFNELQKLANVGPCFCDSELNYNVSWCILMYFCLLFLWTSLEWIHSLFLHNVNIHSVSVIQCILIVWHYFVSCYYYYCFYYYNYHYYYIECRDMFWTSFACFVWPTVSGTSVLFSRYSPNILTLAEVCFFCFYKLI